MYLSSRSILLTKQLLLNIVNLTILHYSITLSLIKSLFPRRFPTFSLVYAGRIPKLLWLQITKQRKHIFK